MHHSEAETFQILVIVSIVNEVWDENDEKQKGGHRIYFYKKSMPFIYFGNQQLFIVITQYSNKNYL